MFICIQHWANIKFVWRITKRIPQSTYPRGLLGFHKFEYLVMEKEIPSPVESRSCVRWNDLTRPNRHINHHRVVFAMSTFSALKFAWKWTCDIPGKTNSGCVPTAHRRGLKHTHFHTHSRLLWSCVEQDGNPDWLTMVLVKSPCTTGHETPSCVPSVTQHVPLKFKKNTHTSMVQRRKPGQKRWRPLLKSVINLTCLCKKKKKLLSGSKQTRILWS